MRRHYKTFPIVALSSTIKDTVDAAVSDWYKANNTEQWKAPIRISIRSEHAVIIVDGITVFELHLTGFSAGMPQGAVTRYKGIIDQAPTDLLLELLLASVEIMGLGMIADIKLTPRLMTFNEDQYPLLNVEQSNIADLLEITALESYGQLVSKFDPRQVSQGVH